MTGTSKETSNFWGVFRRYEPKLVSVKSANDPVYEVIFNNLQKINPGIYIEFSVGPGNKELTITAEGDCSLFSLVESIVSQGPEIPGWTIVALRQKKGFPDTVTWEDFTVSLADIAFEPLRRSGSSDLGLRIFVRGLRNDDIQKCHNAILRAIDYGLGEKKFAESVLATQVVPLPEGRHLQRYIPLVNLEQFLEENGDHKQRL